MPQPARRRFRLYAPYGVIEDKTIAGGPKARRYIRLTYTVSSGEGVRSKTFPGEILPVARTRYQDLLLWGIWYSKSFRNPTDRRKPMSIELRPVPESEQPELV